MKNIFLALALLLYLIADAQTSEIAISDGYELDESENPVHPLYIGKLSVELYSIKDSIVLVHSSKNFRLPHTIKKLKAGDYKLNIYNNDTLFLTIHQLHLNDSSKIEIQLSNSFIVEYNLKKTDLAFPSVKKDRFVSESEFYTTYGRGFIEPKTYPVKNQFTLGFASNGIFQVAKHFSWGINGGLSLSHSYFGKDSSLTPGQHNYERYYQVNLNVGVFARILNKSAVPVRKLSYIDVGASYHLPFACNYSYKDADKKVMTSSIHQYSDCSAFTRIGYKNIALFAQYRLFDYLEAGYPELPKLQVGVTVLLED